jgi:hypothetical protein
LGVLEHLSPTILLLLVNLARGEAVFEHRSTASLP